MEKNTGKVREKSENVVSPESGNHDGFHGTELPSLINDRCYCELRATFTS